MRKKEMVLKIINKLNNNDADGTVVTYRAGIREVRHYLDNHNKEKLELKLMFEDKSEETILVEKNPQGVFRNIFLMNDKGETIERLV
jgi:hypothetical protein